MKKIKYKILYIPDSYRLYIQDFTIDEFLEYDPPCKECLVQATCLQNSTAIVTKYTKFLYLKICEKLFNFITHNEGFYKE